MTALETGVEPGATRASPAGGPGPLQIMIVEDRLGDARLTEEILRQHHPGLQLTTCEHVDDAARALAARAADCVLLDLGPPNPDAEAEADSFDGLNQILAVAPGVPVVVLGGVDDDRLALAALGRGAQEYVTKRELSAAPLWRTIDRAIERANVTREMTHRAHHDPLTGLPNRALFERRVDWAIKCAGRLDTGFSVMLVSIEDLKSLNDNFGHALGDEVVREISRRLESGLDEGDTAYRYEGAEFAVICLTAEHPVGATSIAEWIRDSIRRQPVVVGVRSVNVGVSIGVAIGSADETTAALLHRLDGAIYEAKLTGGACVVN